MIIYKFIPYIRLKIRLLYKLINILFLKFKFGIQIPNSIQIGKNVIIECKEIKLSIGNNVLIGDFSMIKSKKKATLNLGNNISLRRGVLISLFGGELIIGDNVFFNNNCSISCMGKIDIGKETMFGENVKIYDHNHKYEYRPEGVFIYPNEFIIGSVIIGKNCWIASNVTILNNVIIGDNCIIGAGCLIHKSIPSNTVVKNNQNLIYQPNIT